MGTRVGVFGGTFDPIHLGHLVIAEEVRTQIPLDRVVFVPAGLPPHKLDIHVSEAEHRVAMVELAIADNPYFELSRVDVDRFGPCYTVDTVAILRQAWGPEVEIYFIMGSDSLADLVTWRDPERLIRMCRIVAVGRPGYHVDLNELDRLLPGAASLIRVIHTPLLEISSSDIQQRVREGRSIRYLVPKEVEAYIYEHRLYVQGRK